MTRTREWNWKNRCTQKRFIPTGPTLYNQNNIVLSPILRGLHFQVAGRHMEVQNISVVRHSWHFSTTPASLIPSYLVGGLERFIFFHKLGMSSSQLTFIFFRGVDQPPTSLPCQGCRVRWSSDLYHFAGGPCWSQCWSPRFSPWCLFPMAQNVGGFNHLQYISYMYICVYVCVCNYMSNA